MSATGSPSSGDRAAQRPPPPQRIRLDCGWTLDARRAAFLESASLLAVADLHLGYAWAQRSRGLLLPVGVPDTTGARLAELSAEYQPRTIAILGDLIHRAVALEALRPVLEDFCASLTGRELVLCAGNHDRGLGTWVSEWRLPIRIVGTLPVGGFHLCHGDAPQERPGGFALAGEAPFTVQGHEHPAMELGDGRLTRVRVPCHLLSDDTLLLPAFSEWASGCLIGRDAFLGSRARETRFHTAYACMGPRLLPVPLGKHPHPTHFRPRPSERSVSSQTSRRPQSG